MFYLLLLWTPAVLHASGAAPAQAAAASAALSAGVIVGGLTMTGIVDRFGMERVLALGFSIVAAATLAMVGLDAPLWTLAVLLFVAGIGAASQGGALALTGLAYPADRRATGAGWAIGVARTGSIAGPILGGALLAQGLAGRQLYLAVAAVALLAALSAALLGRVRAAQGRRCSVLATNSIADACGDGCDIRQSSGSGGQPAGSS